MKKTSNLFWYLHVIGIIVTFHVLSHLVNAKALGYENTVHLCIYPGCVWVLRHHEHEVEVDQVSAAADADDAALQVCLRLSDGLE